MYYYCWCRAGIFRFGNLCSYWVGVEECGEKKNRGKNNKHKSFQAGFHEHFYYIADVQLLATIDIHTSEI